MEKVIRRALISVYHKEGLAEILKLLHEQGVEFVSTGGTSTFIEGLGYPCVAVEDLTKYPSMLGGRVKTLHPAIQGGILARRGHETDQKEVLEYGLSLIDLVIVDLYPFEATVASGASEEISSRRSISAVSASSVGQRRTSRTSSSSLRKQTTLRCLRSSVSVVLARPSRSVATLLAAPSL